MIPALAIARDLTSKATLYWKGLTLLVRVETVTPEMASAYLERNTRNRPMRNFMPIAAAIRDGEWMLNGETIIFAKSGRLLDGQNRLRAIVESDTACDVLIVEGIPDDAFKTLDRSKTRNSADTFSINGEINCVLLQSICSMAKTYIDGALTVAHSGDRAGFTPSKAEALLADHPELREATHFAASKKLITLVSPTVAGFCWWLFNSIDKDACEEFMEGWSTGASLARGNPILALRQRLLNDKDRKISKRAAFDAALAVVAWNKWRRNETCDILKIPSAMVKFPDPI